MKTNDNIPQTAPEGNPTKGDWWSTPHRPTRPLNANEQRAAAREAARDRAKCPHHHRRAANAAAEEARTRLAPWASEHRVTTAWPNPRATWGEKFHAMCCVRKRFGAEEVVAEAQAPTLAGALDALTAALRALVAKGTPVESRWAAPAAPAAQICPKMPHAEAQPAIASGPETLSFYDEGDFRPPVKTTIGNIAHIITARPNSGDELAEILYRAAAGLRCKPYAQEALSALQFGLMFQIPSPPCVDRPTWVYFATDGDHIKIGFTKNVAARMKSIARARLTAVKVIVEAHGDRDDEKRLHAALRPHQWKSEWFHDTPAVRRVVEHVKRAGIPDAGTLARLCAGIAA